MDAVVKKVLVWSAIVVVIVTIFGLLTGEKEIYLGFTLGGLISMLNFYMMAQDITLVVKYGGKAKKEAMFKYARRYLVIFLILTIAVKVFRFGNFFGLIAGLFVIQGVIFVQKVIFKK